MASWCSWGSWSRPSPGAPLWLFTALLLELALSLALLAVVILAATGASLATNRVAARWRDDPRRARPGVVALGGLWILMGVGVLLLHVNLALTPHHWTVHLLGLLYLPVLPALGGLLLASFWRPPATAS